MMIGKEEENAVKAPSTSPPVSLAEELETEDDEVAVVEEDKDVAEDLEEQQLLHQLPIPPHLEVSRQAPSLAAGAGPSHLYRDASPSRLPLKSRASFTPSQLEELERQFRAAPYATPEMRTALASLLGITDRQVQVWFQNRRRKDRDRGEAPSASTSSQVRM